MKCNECSRELELKSKKNKDTEMYYQQWECVACGAVKDPTDPFPSFTKNATTIPPFYMGIDSGMDGGGAVPIKYVPGYGFKVLEGEEFTITDHFKKGRT